MAVACSAAPLKSYDAPVGVNAPFPGSAHVAPFSQGHRDPFLMARSALAIPNPALSTRPGVSASMSGGVMTIPPLPAQRMDIEVTRGASRMSGSIPGTFGPACTLDRAVRPRSHLARACPANDPRRHACSLEPPGRPGRSIPGRSPSHRPVRPPGALHALSSPGSCTRATPWAPSLRLWAPSRPRRRSGASSGGRAESDPYSRAPTHARRSTLLQMPLRANLGPHDRGP